MERLLRVSQDRDRGVERFHQEAERSGAHDPFGQQIDRLWIVHGERQHRRRDHDLLDAQVFQPADAFDRLLRGSRQRVGTPPLPRVGVHRAAREPRAATLERRLRGGLVLGEDRVEPHRETEGGRIASRPPRTPHGRPPRGRHSPPGPRATPRSNRRHVLAIIRSNRGPPFPPTQTGMCPFTGPGSIVASRNVTVGPSMVGAVPRLQRGERRERIFERREPIPDRTEREPERIEFLLAATRHRAPDRVARRRAGRSSSPSSRGAPGGGTARRAPASPGARAIVMVASAASAVMGSTAGMGVGSPP